MICSGRRGRYISSMPQRGAVVINVVIYAELSIGYVRIEEVEQVLSDTGLEMREITRPALFLAGKVFQRYRAQRGSRAGVLPDLARCRASSVRTGMGKGSSARSKTGGASSTNARR
jgi:hypothetical protein